MTGAKLRSLLHPSHPDRKGFKPSRDEGELYLTGIEPMDDERSDMESSREAEHAYSEVISPSLLASLRELVPSWLCPLEFKLRIGDDWEGPFAGIDFETTCDQNDFLLEASHLLGAKGDETAIGSKERHFDDAEVNDLLLLASQALESDTEKAQLGTSKGRFSFPVSSTKVQKVRK